MDAKAMIKLENASIGYHRAGADLAVAGGIGLTFFAGDFVGVAGLNGVGKSTFLKSIAGLLPLLAGELLIDGSPSTQLSLQQMATRVAIVLTERVGGFNLTAFDAVAAGQIPYTNAFHQLKPQHLAVVREAITRCRLEGHEQKKLHELSDGLFQKTMIAKGLAQQTPVLLLDEPSAYLDYASKHELFLLLKALSQELQKCVLVSSHDLDLVLRYCNKVLVFSDQHVELVPVSLARTHKAFAAIAGGYI